MQTFSHFLITVFAHQQAQRWGWFPRRVPTPALLVGAVLPDIPFTLLTLGYGLYYRSIGSTPTGESLMIYMHFTLFFEDPPLDHQPQRFSLTGDQHAAAAARLVGDTSSQV